jgi:alpha-beta hydrolase superfamily lysophospholipase
VRAVGEILEECLEALDLSPEGIFAHSAGGFLALHWLGRRARACPRLAGLRWLWLSSPLVRPSHRQPRWKVALATRLARHLPAMTLSTGVKARDCHHSALLAFAEAERIRDGVHHRVSLRFATSLLQEEPALPQLVAEIPPGLALLLTQGAEDEVCPPRYADDLFHRFPSQEKTCLLVGGARHEPIREPDAPGLRISIQAWLDARG